MSKWEMEADNERLRDRLDRRDEDIADLQRVIDAREARIEELEEALKEIAENRALGIYSATCASAALASEKNQ